MSEWSTQLAHAADHVEQVLHGYAASLGIEGSVKTCSPSRPVT